MLRCKILPGGRGCPAARLSLLVFNYNELAVYDYASANNVKRNECLHTTEFDDVMGKGLHLARKELVEEQEALQEKMMEINALLEKKAATEKRIIEIKARLNDVDKKEREFNEEKDAQEKKKVYSKK
jgi:hypothetical protein